MNLSSISFTGIPLRSFVRREIFLKLSISSKFLLPLPLCFLLATQIREKKLAWRGSDASSPLSSHDYGSLREETLRRHEAEEGRTFPVPPFVGSSVEAAKCLDARILIVGAGARRPPLHRCRGCIEVFRIFLLDGAMVIGVYLHRREREVVGFVNVGDSKGVGRCPDCRIFVNDARLAQYRRISLNHRWMETLIIDERGGARRVKRQMRDATAASLSYD